MAERRSFETLNLLRGLAALMVLVWHLPGVEQKSYWSAYLSVDLFFSLSGVVVAHAYERRLLDGWRFHRFVIARVIRLWPLYLLGTAIAGVAGVAVAARAGGAAWMFKPLARDASRAVLLWPCLSDGVEFPLDPPAWSLLAEFVVNLFYGAVLVRWRARRLVAVALAAAAVMAIGVFHFRPLDAALNLGTLAEHWWMGLARAFYSFPVGVLIQRAWRAGRLPHLAMPPSALAGVFLLVLIVTPGEGRWAAPAALAVVLVVLPALVAAATQVEPQGALRRAAQVTADLSYPIYVMHDAFFILAGTIGALAGVPWAASTAAALAATLLSAPIADRFYDRPVRRLLTRLATMPRAAAAAANPL